MGFGAIFGAFSVVRCHSYILAQLSTKWQISFLAHAPIVSGVSYERTVFIITKGAELNTNAISASLTDNERENNTYLLDT